MIKKMIKNKKGSISIIGIIITIIIVTALAGYISILNSSWVFNEVQSIMDLCATNALQQSIDSQALRKEILGVKNPSTGSSGTDTSISSNGDWKTKTQAEKNKINDILKALYQAELNKNISTNSMILGVKLVNFESDLVYSSWGSTYNSNAKSRPQLRLQAVTQITLKANSQFDGLNNYKLSLFNAKNKGTIDITVAGVTGDGKVILTVRTLSRILYK